MSVNEKEIGIKNFEKFISKNTGMQLNASLWIITTITVIYWAFTICMALYAQYFIDFI